MATRRDLLARAHTFVRFATQQVLAQNRIACEMADIESSPFAIEAPTVGLNGGERDWKSTGVSVVRGAKFAVSARGALWLSRPLCLVLEPRATLWVRISDSAHIAKLVGNDVVFTAWADGNVEVLLKALSEWAFPAGDLLPQRRSPAAGEIRVRIALTQAPATEIHSPANWDYLWRLGDGTIYRADAAGCIDIQTHGDVGILQTNVDHPVSPSTRLEWSWRVDRLPSQLPEDLVFTHDYLAVAAEFDDGKDLTFMWSAGLPNDHIFACPLSFWCDRETHWVIRTPLDRLGKWHDESRNLWQDTLRAYGRPPARVVRLWLIANSVFQRNSGTASVQDLRLTDRE